MYRKNFPIIITQKINNQFNQKPNSLIAPAHQLDHGHSKVYATSTYKKFQNGLDVTKEKISDDAIVIGYTHQGLPFMLVFDGAFGDADASGNVVWPDILPKIAQSIPDYSRQLSVTHDPQQVTKNFIKSLDKLHQCYKHAENARFTLSLAVIYEKGEKQYCAGFGIGDTGIVIKRSNKRVEQLAHNNVVNNFKDMFGESRNYGGNTAITEAVINRNSIFHVAVAVGDEIVGYTNIEPKMEIEARKKSASSAVVKRQLHPEKFDLTSNTSLFDQVVKLNAVLFQQRCNQQKKSSASGKYHDYDGDDCTIGVMTVPSVRLKSTIKSNIQQACLATDANITSDYLNNRNKEGYFHYSLSGAIGAFFSSKKGFSKLVKKGAAEMMKKIIEGNDGEHEYCQPYHIAAIKEENSNLNRCYNSLSFLAKNRIDVAIKRSTAQKNALQQQGKLAICDMPLMG